MMKRFFYILIAVSLVTLLSGCESTKKNPPVEEAPAVEAPDVNDEEYNRSTAGVTISRETFNADKKEILQIISELAVVMQKYDYDSWLKYIEPNSITYWSNPFNLRNATKRLPNKSIKLTSLNDYFTYVFVPSRKERTVEEIRYVSLDSVKAVQMRDETDIVYYNFVKVDGKWMVKLPSLSPSSN